MFDNCKVLSKDYRMRWSLSVDEDSIDMGLEAAIGSMDYLAFGWANPNQTSRLMLGADVAVAGFTENGMPYVDDFFITRYSECVVKDGKPEGVCPDARYEDSGSNELVNNTQLVYGHRKDGVSFIRYKRPLKSVDNKYDLQVDRTKNMTVIWATGLMMPLRLPQNHGGPESVKFGHLVLNVSEHINDCLGPLDAQEKEDQDLVIADGTEPLVVMTGLALHYPNPPNPPKVLYINKKEAPVLRVERGVPVKFSIQAGHDVALYITSDLLGGNATTRNRTETIYAGGQDAHGVQANPTELIWAPNRNTPDQVYYHSLYHEKMGWKIQVVDGGLPDMYNNSIILDDQQVTFFWTLSEDSISIAARGERKSGYLAIGFGSAMVNSYAYVGWIDDEGRGHVNTYWINRTDPSKVYPTHENVTYVRCRSENDIVTLEFTHPLKPSCGLDHRPECENIIDTTTPLRVIWAMGARWTGGHLTERNMHTFTSSRPVRVLLMRGSAEAEQDLLPVLSVHGFMMFLAWGILLPGGILAVRYLKHVKGGVWFRVHVYMQYSGLAIVFLGLLFAVAELRAFNLDAFHVKIGSLAILLVCAQPVNACLRPKRPAEGEGASPKRVAWEYVHFIVGRGAIVAGVAALFSGMQHLGDRYGSESVHGLNWALIVWFLVGAGLVVYLEYCKRRRNNGVSGSHLEEEEDSVHLLSSTETRRMEIQLEPSAR